MVVPPTLIFVSTNSKERVNSTGSLWLLLGYFFSLRDFIRLTWQVLRGSESSGCKDLGDVGYGPVGKDSPARRRKGVG